MKKQKILIVGEAGGTHIGGSLFRAAEKLGHTCLLADSKFFFSESLFQKTKRHILGTKSDPRIRRTQIDNLIKRCLSLSPSIIIVSGLVPIPDQVISYFQEKIGAKVAVYLTDDPWNRNLYFRYPIALLPKFNHVFTPRRASITDLESIGCQNLTYLPFGFDSDLFYIDPMINKAAGPPDCLFVGGCDEDRIEYGRALLNAGLNCWIIGGYWARAFPNHPGILGIRSADFIRSATTRAKVNICLVRKANRDGHVMRTFEILACGGRGLFEDTGEHRDLLSNISRDFDYFGNIQELVSKTQIICSSRRVPQIPNHPEQEIQSHSYQASLTHMLKTLDP